MKTKIIALITMSIVALGITNSSYAAASNNATVTILNNVSTINKIEVYGNVELYISDGSADQVKVYNKYYSESALIQSTNGVLRISSYTPEKLVVWVTAADLRSITAYDNSEVKSSGDLSKIEFNVDLHNNASAKLNFDAFSANVNVTDSAKADLSGSANDLSLNHNTGSVVNKSNFTAIHVNENKINAPVPADDADIAGL